MITCLVCTARIPTLGDVVGSEQRVCADCRGNLSGAREMLARRRQMSEARLGGALAKLAQLIGQADEELVERWDKYLMAQAETPRPPQTQRRLDAMAAAYKAGQLDTPMIDLLYAEGVVNAARDAVVRDDVAIQFAERAIAALSLVYELDGRWTRHSRDGGHYLRRVADGLETSPYTSLEAACQAAERVDRRAA